MTPMHSLGRCESLPVLDTLPAAAVSGYLRSSNTTRRTLPCSSLVVLAAATKRRRQPRWFSSTCARPTVASVGRRPGMVMGQGVPTSASPAPGEDGVEGCAKGPPAEGGRPFRAVRGQPPSEGAPSRAKKQPAEDTLIIVTGPRAKGMAARVEPPHTDCALRLQF